jgi:UDP-glucose 4-epimerase
MHEPMKILVTGGAGFIGSNVVDAYINAGHEVVVVDDLSSGKQENLNPGAKFYLADIRSEEIKKIFEEERPEVLNHHAAQISVPASVEDPIFDADVNIKGLLNLLEAAVKNETKKVVFISSGGAIYGEAVEYPTSEAYPPIPLSPYAITKFASEKYLAFYDHHYGLDYTVLRYANIYGPRQIPHGEAGVVAIFMENLLEKRPSTLYHFPDEPRGMVRDYCYVEDVARANILALEAGSREAFNIGTGTETHTIDLRQGPGTLKGAVSRWTRPGKNSAGRQGWSSKKVSKRPWPGGWTSKQGNNLMEGQTEKPLVSIVTPTLNSERFIRDNIRSIQSQTYPNIEHIVVDGCSSDKTLSMVKELDPKAKVTTEPDEGISDAFNKGIRMASGEIIAILNSDDYFANEHVVQRVVDIFVTRPDVKAVYGKVECIDPKDGQAVIIYGRPLSLKKTEIMENISHPAFFVKHDVYDAIGHYSLEYKSAMDYDFFLRVSKSYEPYYLNEILTIMRWGGYGASNIFRGHRETYKIMRSNGVNTISALADLFYRYTITMLSLALQKMGLAGVVLFYRKKKGRL